ncbi:MAG: serine/threonine protein phosphatase, partial [Bacteroidetes bacterium]
MFKNKGLAFKLSLYLLTVTFAVLFALLYYNYVISRNLVLKDAQNDAQKLTELTVARIENVLQGVESIPLSLASVIENRDTVRFIGTRKVIENVLVKNPLIYGACIAFAPGIKEKDTTYFAPYLYSSGDSIIFKDLASDEYR